MTKNLLVLDLDETLLHSRRIPLDREPDFHAHPYAVYFRPHLESFLEQIFRWYDVAVWTSAGEDYARIITGRLFPDLEQLRFIWSANRCTRGFNSETLETFSIKDLRKLRRLGYDLKRVLVVDDSPEKHLRNYGNLIRVSPFEGDLADGELPTLASYLESLKDHDNYRAIEKRGWRSAGKRTLE
jgi:carboxy-terminal domain RNA polymerase II polypeptide A small phosphatase